MVVRYNPHAGNIRRASSHTATATSMFLVDRRKGFSFG